MASCFSLPPARRVIAGSSKKSCLCGDWVNRRFVKGNPADPAGAQFNVELYNFDKNHPPVSDTKLCLQMHFYWESDTCATNRNRATSRRRFPLGISANTVRMFTTEYSRKVENTSGSMLMCLLKWIVIWIIIYLKKCAVVKPMEFFFSSLLPFQ